ncbi:class I SAM-dependent methyltransferase [Amycolatopsis halotolerans]|uniref:Class I SAM-dependent methyltransferase n=1 Tax=Amycolatopsis halotolerans TaxID=330083 RepID=A0ABV7QQR6_9PSEU
MTAQAMIVDGRDLDAQASALRTVSPRLHGCLDPVRLATTASTALDGSARDFGPETAGGRGGAYVRAQTAQLAARADGIRALLGLFGPAVRRPDAVVLDLLGGNGLVRQVNDRLGLIDAEILTCDGAPHMVSAAWAQGSPAVLQRAQHLVVRDGSVDGVLLAYGTHHIPEEERAGVALEARRVLRAGGVFVLHDFEIGSPMDTWFTEIVDPHSATGHRYPHLTRAMIEDHLATAGFGGYRITEILDPYVTTAPTREEARLRLGRYLTDMYGLVKAEAELGPEDVSAWAARRAEEIFCFTTQDGRRARPRFERTADGQWAYLVPRPALVGMAVK